MTPPIFHLDDEVEIIGVRCDGQAELAGKRFKISQYHVDQDGERCSAIGFPWYPASSLRLVEELKIGDYAEITGMSLYLDNSCLGKVFRIEEVRRDGLIPTHGRLYLPTSLRKLTQEEIAMHTGTIGYKTQEIQDEVENVVDAIRNLIAPDIYEQLSALESRLKEDRNLMTEIEERMDERQDVTDCALKTMGQSIGSLWEAIHKQNSEMPLPLVGFAVSMCGPVPACITSAIRRESEEAEKRKLEGDCKPNDEFHVIICKGGNEYANHYFRCPNDAIDWTKKVLDGMREG